MSNIDHYTEATLTSTISPSQEAPLDAKNDKSSFRTIENIHSKDQFLSFLSKHPANSLCVVKFHSDTCPTCKRIVMKYIRIANKYTRRCDDMDSDEGKRHGTQVFFSEINVSKNSDLASSLDIEEYPFIHIYRNLKCVASFGTGPPENFSKMLEYMLDHEIHMSDEDWIWFESSFEKQIQEGTDKILKLITELGA
jgi:thiol-disulfide isomerase/thioredoxin